MLTLIAAAKDVLHEAGLLVDAVKFDGELHRVPVIDKPHGKDGAYIAHSDAPASVWWQNWRNGESAHGRTRNRAN
jgi:putative DNA primase/helicase